MSFAGLPKRNLRNFETPSAPLRSHTKAGSLMGFAGLQVCFQPKCRKTHQNSTQWNKNKHFVDNLWKSPR